MGYDRKSYEEIMKKHSNAFEKLAKSEAEDKVVEAAALNYVKNVPVGAGGDYDHQDMVQTFVAGVNYQKQKGKV